MLNPIPCVIAVIIMYLHLTLLLNTAMIPHSYCDPVPFPFLDQLRLWSRSQTWPRDRDLWVAMSYGATVNVPMDPDLLSQLRLWFLGRNLVLHNCYSFIRSAHTVKPKDIHVDTHGHSDDPCAASLVIVTEGSGPMIWYQGDYTLARHQHSWGSSYYDILGLDTLREAHRDPMLQPQLCRADIPHTGICSADSDHRVTVTFRFRGNPSYDHVLAKLCA